MTARQTLIDLFHTGVNAVRGDVAVEQALTSGRLEKPDQIIAVGKAAAAMASAALKALGAQTPCLVVTKYGHTDGVPKGVEMIEAAHPVLDKNSLNAGQRVIEVVEAMPKRSTLLMLVSGGASSLAEWPQTPTPLAELLTFYGDLQASGLNIHAMNAQRKARSAIKGGKLLARFKGSSVTTLAISDVEGDDLGVIGSGIGDARADAKFAFNAQIVASNAVARRAIAAKHEPATNSETLYGDITEIAAQVAQHSQTKGLHIFGGEPTTTLPPNPKRGGRNQALALTLAKHIAGQSNVTLLVGGTDGTDGPTQDAGGIVDGTTWTDSAQTALDHADSGTYLDARDALLTTGPTGTNVMDLVIVLRT